MVLNLIAIHRRIHFRRIHRRVHRRILGMQKCSIPRNSWIFFLFDGD